MARVHNRGVAGLFVLGFPFVLLGFMLFMERVERPLTRAATERKVERFLDDANDDELDVFVREGTDSALGRLRRRLRRARARS